MIHSISAVSWMINTQCNLSCVHCYTNSAPFKEKRPDFTDDDIRRLGDSISSLSPKMIFLSGGEPTIDFKFFSFLETARRVATDDVWVCTTGSVLTLAFLEKAAALGLNGVSLSLQNTDRRLDAALRRSSRVYDKFFEAAKLVKQVGLKLVVEMTITKLSLHDLDAFIDTGISVGADVVMFKRLRPLGRGKDDKSIEITPKENMDALRRIVKRALRTKEVSIKVDDPLYGVVIMELARESGEGPDSYLANFDSEFKTIIPSNSPCETNIRSLDAISQLEALDRPKRVWGCKAGIEWVGVDPHANVSPCPLMLEAGMIIGNLREQSLADIVNASPEVAFFREATAHSDCSFSAVCGGCRAHAAGAKGDFFAKDPMCEREGTCLTCKPKNARFTQFSGVYQQKIEMLKVR